MLGLLLPWTLCWWPGALVQVFIDWPVLSHCMFKGTASLSLETNPKGGNSSHKQTQTTPLKWQPSDHCQQGLLKNPHGDISLRDLEDGSALRVLGALAEDLGSKLLVTPAPRTLQAPTLICADTNTHARTQTHTRTAKNTTNLLRAHHHSPWVLFLH